VIQESFNVEQVATYFAVNAVLSHWDGFFNNYFAYHDSGGTGKWEVYPWDQDKTSGYYDGVGDGEVFFDMPLTFGMNGAAPPGARRDSGEGGPAERGRSRSPFGFGGPFGGGASWWRPPGHFSGPLLANHHFRKVFLRRTREVLETVFTPEACAPFLEGMTERLRGESERAARARGEDPVAAVRLLERDTESLREHLLKRRQFLLADEELSAAKGGG
jgi:spore coat protein CotH